MKRGNAVKGLAVLLSILTLSSGICGITAFAGSHDTVIGNSSFAETINTDIWNNPEGDVTAENGKLIFPKDGTEETRLITSAAARKNERLKELFRASVTMRLTALPEGETFAFAFGLQSQEAYQGNKGNVEVAFTNQGGLQVAVIAYGNGGKATTVVGASKCSGLNRDIAIEANLTSEGNLTLKVAGKTLCNGTKLPVSGEGRLGFLQTGSCGAQVSKVDIAIRGYDAPENVNINETFDNGYMNTAVLTSKTVWSSDYYPQSLSVKEYKGNKVLAFERTYLSYIGTRYPYSNFEMTFDVPYMYRKDVRDENGTLVEPATANLVISLGGDSVDHSGYGYTQAAETIVFHPSSTISDYRSNHSGRDENHLVFSSQYESDKGFSVKISIIDGVVSVGLKWLEEKDYSTVLTYTRESGTPTGYIHIWSNVLGNMAIDNLKIVNKDLNPKLLTVEPTHDSFDRVPDFKYEKQELKFRDDTKKEEEDKTEEKPAIIEKIEAIVKVDDLEETDLTLLIYAGVSGAVLLIGGFITGEVLRRKRNKQMGGKEDEA